MNFAQDKSRIGIVGLGRSGIAAAKFLAERGYEVLAWDQNQATAAALADQPRITCIHTADPKDSLIGCRAVLLSPGIPRSHPCLTQLLIQGVPVINDVEWLYRHSHSSSKPAYFIGITGTNGKSTVTTLVGEMLCESKFNTGTGGNLGQPALSLWDEKVEKFVLELSSFQLESLPCFRAQTAALLNISPDHLDRYKNISGYMAAKLHIFANQKKGDNAIINADEPILMAAYEQTATANKVNLIPFSTQQQLPGGFYIKDDQLIDHRGNHPQPLLACDQLKIAGIHNQANALAAAAIALAAGATREAVVTTLSSFPGLPHRMEWVKDVDGVAYYNDSKGTNVGAVIQSIASFPEGLVLIAGGRDKNSDFAPLVELVEKHVSNLILIGEAAETMAQLFAEHSNISQAGSMKEAVSLARQLAKPGETVLLSPACASFDMFKNFEERGEIFRKVVHEL
jgi:UDP-N-acetylmuramoylalanine--D-glutamate ligase